MRILKIAALAAVMMLPAMRAQASVLGSVLTFNGSRDDLIDQSSSIAVDLDGSGGYSEGDVIFGFVRIDTVNRDVPLTGSGLSAGAGTDTVVTPGELGVIFSAQIVANLTDPGDTTPSTVGETYSLAATTVTGLTLLDILSPGLAAEISPQLSAASDTIFVGVSSTTSGPINGFSTTDFTAADFDLEIAGGIAAGSDDFFHFAQSDFLNPFSGVEAGGFTIFDQTLGPDIVFIEDVAVDKDFGLGEDITEHEATLFNGTLTGAGLTTIDVDLDASGDIAIDGSETFGAAIVTNNSNFGLNAIPEPTTFIVWGLLSSFAGVACIRRRNSA